MKAANPQTIQLKDYKIPPYSISTVDLDFDLHEEHVDVVSHLKLEKNEKGEGGALVLDGEKLELRSVKLDGKLLQPGEYAVTETALTIAKVPSSFSLEITTRIKPQENLTLEGLYKSSGMFCTQCEAQGFRKITYYLDRPDVMAIFTTTIRADKAKYPILLSNGNPIEQKDLGGGRHLAKWKDPFKKPAYLYALVAGDLGRSEDHFITRSGRRVKLEIYVDKGNEDRTAHAMDSLKKSMKWDEETFGLEYDLDIFMIVAVDDFNFGAMENKGLNIFNSSLVLAKPETATDSDYDAIEAVVAHEYFHNWTGNRITCRDWFQLSLKEGLTVYRDQEFSADHNSRAVKRIEDANMLRSRQFPEDAGPMAHPIRPSSYIEINNFYTTTVYEKGAEVIRMIATLVGKAGFRKGMDKYFELFDGQAVTTEDFVRSMEIANGIDLTQFRDTWYNQAGTPELRVKGYYDATAKRYDLEVAQSCPPSPGQKEKRPYHMPFSVALIDKQGKQVAEKVLQLKQEKETFSFANIHSEPLPSLLRGFSAPVKVLYDYSLDDLLFLFAKDADPFARWEAGQKASMQVLLKMVAAHADGKAPLVDERLLGAVGHVLEDTSIDDAFKAQLLEIPEEGYIGQQLAVIPVDSVHAAREALIEAIAKKHEAKLLKIYEACKDSGPYKFHHAAVGKRALKRTALQLLMATGNPSYRALAFTQLKSATNMTDEIAALGALVHAESKDREDALDLFYQKWKNETLVINKWLGLQALSKVPGGLERVKRLMKDPVFNINNPNKVRHLIGAFGSMNHVQFHALDGAAYRFLADFILDADTRNPSLAARMTSLFNQWKRYDSRRQELMKKELERIVAKAGVSAGVFEIASKALK
jgi:aminopeptidase N